MDAEVSLPVEAVLDELVRAVEAGDAVLEAPPGAGKTTLVPLALARAPILSNSKIIVLEPRRLAAKSAAFRMAAMLRERVGQTVGYRVRLETVVSEATRIEVVTEGVLTRMLQTDPSLEGVGAVVFDEFHERSLDADLALALSLKGRAMFRGNDDPLRLIVMSATLDTRNVARLLGGPDAVPVIHTEGRMYPVEVKYGRASSPRDRIVDRMVETIRQALGDNPDSSVLAFLPGQGEIARTAEALGSPAGVRVFELYGNLPLDEQQSAIAPSPSGERKVVLATNLAETSLTIEGVDVVVDSGLVREPVFDPGTAMTRLQTVRISAASSVQRMGRAGRLRPGRCYRLWSKSQQDELAPHAKPEILGADLAPVALRMLAWGLSDPGELEWMDPPPGGAWSQAMSLLGELGATRQVQAGIVLSPMGEAMASIPAHPRIGHMLIRGREIGEERLACLLAAWLSDRDPFPDDPDVAHRVEILEGEKGCPDRQRGWKRRTLDLARQFGQRLGEVDLPRRAIPLERQDAIGFLLACAYPDRIARRRHSGGYQLANGRSANFVSSNYLSKQRWLAVAETGGARGKRGDVIRSAAVLAPALFDSALAGLKRAETVCEWDERSGRFIAEHRERIGELVLSRSKLDTIPAEAKTSMLADYVRRSGINALKVDRDFRRWQARMQLARQSGALPALPDVSDEALIATLGEWLEPYLASVSRLDELKKLDLVRILSDRIGFDERKRLDKFVPEQIEVPSGSRIDIDYTANPPSLAVKLQEMFGCEQAPSILDGRVSLQVHLLSPAGRRLQVTQDLAHFWREGYESVRKEMKGRYPKHPWPEDPLTAKPTRETKRRR